MMMVSRPWTASRFCARSTSTLLPFPATLDAAVIAHVDRGGPDRLNEPERAERLLAAELPGRIGDRHQLADGGGRVHTVVAPTHGGRLRRDHRHDRVGRDGQGHRGAGNGELLVALGHQRLVRARAVEGGVLRPHGAGDQEEERGEDHASRHVKPSWRCGWWWSSTDW